MTSITDRFPSPGLGFTIRRPPRSPGFPADPVGDVKRAWLFAPPMVIDVPVTVRSVGDLVPNPNSVGCVESTVYSDTGYMDKPCVLSSNLGAGLQPLMTARKQLLAEPHALRIFLVGPDL